MPPRPSPKPKPTPKLGRPLGKFTQNRRYNRLREALEGAPAGLTILEIAELLRITQRSARRYLDEVKRALDLEPVLITPGGANRWRIKATERGRSVALRRTQAIALLSVRDHFEAMKGAALYEEIHVAMEAIRQIAERPGRAVHKAERKGGATAVPPCRFLVTPATARNHAARAEDIDELFGAIIERHDVRFAYPGRPDEDAEPRETVAHPLALVVHAGALCFIAHDWESDEARLFLFDRMSSIAQIEARRDTSPEFRLEQWLHGEFGVMPPGKPFRVIVEFDAAAADTIRPRKVHPTQKFATAPDGRVRVSFMVPDLGPVKTWVLSFGGHAHAVEPESLRVDVALELQRALAKYGL